MAGKQQTRTLGTALRFIASLVFLYVVFVTFQALSPSTGGAAAGALWAPLAYTVAVVGSVALFFSSLVGFGWSAEKLTMGANKAVLYTTVALLAWAFIAGGSATTVELVLVGFIIGWFGSVVEK